MAKGSKGKRQTKKPETGAQIVVMSGGAALAAQPGFMEALHAFQYGESAEESEAGFRKMVDTASGPAKSDGGK